MLRQIAEEEAEAGIKFKVLETGGKSVKAKVQVSNPTATAGCAETDCMACRPGRGEGGNCHGSGINYEIECQLCPAEARSVYLGETARNLYSRGKEHEGRYRNGGRKSFMKKHQDRKHPGVAGSYTAKVSSSSKDCLTRQVTEAVKIRRCQVPLLNSKTEWHQPALWQVQNEIYRGWVWQKWVWRNLNKLFGTRHVRKK